MWIYCLNEEEQIILENSLEIGDYNLCRIIIEENLYKIKTDLEESLIHLTNNIQGNANLTSILIKYKKLLDLNNFVMQRLNDF